MIDSETFRRLRGRIASGIAILTARDGDRDVGMTVSAFCSVSLSPPLLLVCIERTASMHDLLFQHPKLGLSIIASEHEAHSRRFAEQNNANRFEGLPFSRGESRVMLLDNATAHLECQPIRHIEAGDHTIFILEVERGTMRDARPLLYYRGTYAQLAH
jgi:flavin reductase (DIM6/NTAB) family NADH-FMN oxidoreductase RutF